MGTETWRARITVLEPTSEPPTSVVDRDELAGALSELGIEDGRAAMVTWARRGGRDAAHEAFVRLGWVEPGVDFRERGASWLAASVLAEAFGDPAAVGTRVVVEAEMRHPDIEVDETDPDALQDFLVRLLHDAEDRRGPLQERFGEGHADRKRLSRAMRDAVLGGRLLERDGARFRYEVYSPLDLRTSLVLDEPFFSRAF